MRSALLIDFGSTYTKLRAINIDERVIIGSGQGPSTVDTDVTLGFKAALADLEHRIGKLPDFSYRLASSSAAGGLRMITVGLVPALTAEAARRAALGAGARLIGTYSYQLTAADAAEIKTLDPDILLLAGGTDGGDQKFILHNATMLGKTELRCPVILAGNRNAVDAALEQLGSLTVIVTENVLPELNKLNVDPARAAIRQVFIDRIVHAKGIDRAQGLFDAVLMPTPVAVLEAAQLLADGIDADRPGLGELLVLDPGGATTDVHSICAGSPAEGIVALGLPEPRVKRTVEGDLGMRHSAAAIIENVGIEQVAKNADLLVAHIEKILAGYAANADRLPESADELALDEALAYSALQLATQRHAGRLETVYTAIGPATVQYGKDLSNVSTIIGTGGIMAHLQNAHTILSAACARTASSPALLPRQPELLLDQNYILYACGLLASVDKEAAYDLAVRQLYGEKVTAHD